MTKYGNRPVVIDGYKFPSAAEGARYQELRLLERAGEIEQLRVHPRYEVLERFQDGQGRWHQAVVYEADFEYVEGGQKVVAEDVKGGRATQTPLFRLKCKLFWRRYPEIELRVVET